MHDLRTRRQWPFLFDPVNAYQIDCYEFSKGLAFGLRDGGIETLKEIGPFLANVLFHPFQTTSELITSIKFIFKEVLEEKWESVFETLTPELKELFLSWDNIEDYHKGRLTGLFIGKNGVAALTAIGAVKTLSKLKNAVIGIDKTKFTRLFKSTKPEITTLPASELTSLTTLNNKGWNLPSIGGEIVECNFFSEHGFAQIASDSTSRSLLEAKAIHKTKELGLPFATWEEVEEWALIEKSKSFSFESTAIPPSVIETEIVNSEYISGKIEIVLNENGNIVKTLHLSKTGKILVQNKNKQIHIMQPKHAWDKVIKLTGNVEEDCKNVVKLLEEHQIFLEKYRFRPAENFENIARYTHQMEINDFQIKAIFNKNLETGEMFLNDAWVMTK